MPDTEEGGSSRTNATGLAYFCRKISDSAPISARHRAEERLGQVGGIEVVGHVASPSPNWSSG